MERAELMAVLRATGCAEERGGFVFLCDPNWSAADRAEISALQSSIENPQSKIDSGWLAVRTGGSGGGVKFARHDERTLTAAVTGFCAHFGLARVNAVDVLPAHHVSGLMARVRCAATGGEHVGIDWKQLEAGAMPTLRDSKGWVISLVPTQLQRLLGAQAAVDWLRQFKVIFLGGGPVWPELAEAAAEARLPLSLSYGMTETAAMVTALRPQEFLAGQRSCGAPLPHARVRIHEMGVVAVAGESVAHGYLLPDGAPTAQTPFRPLSVNASERENRGREFVTEDMGRFDERGHLHLLGRRDAVIITGGKKVQPEAVEAALRASGEFVDVVVLGVPDREWGEAVVACYVATSHALDVARATMRLAPHERPKRFVAIADWPRNAQGKVNRAELARVVRAGANGS